MPQLHATRIRNNIQQTKLWYHGRKNGGQLAGQASEREVIANRWVLFSNHRVSEEHEMRIQAMNEQNPVGSTVWRVSGARGRVNDNGTIWTQ